MRNLQCLSGSELKAFLNSFDNVLCDCDGVLWKGNEPFKGVQETIDTLKRLGKNVRVVSNNSTQGASGLHNVMNEMHIKVELDDIAIPSMAVIDHLKKINYDKKIFVIGTSFMKKDFIKEGFVEENYKPNNIDENLESLKKIIKDDKNIGAVFLDFDPNLNFAMLNKCLNYLLRHEVHFFVGLADNRLPIGLAAPVIGSGYFQNILTDITGRAPIHFGKPHTNFQKYIKEKFQINDPSRTIFVGDSLAQDIGFATKCGYQKLLVLTGNTTLKKLKQCTNTDMIPNFYIENFGNLDDLIKEKLNV